MLILRSGLDETAVKADSGDFPLVALRQVLVGRHDHIARNSLSIFLPDYVVELAIGNKVHAGKRYRVGCNWADEANRAVPCVRVIGKEEFMTESDWTVGEGVRFVAATRISPCRSLRLSSLDVAIKTFPKKIGAVSGVPDEVIFGDGWVAGCHGRILNESGSDAMESHRFLWRGSDGRFQKRHRTMAGLLRPGNPSVSRFEEETCKGRRARELCVRFVPLAKRRTQPAQWEVETRLTPQLT